MILRGWRAWNNFWFESHAPARKRIFRIALGTLLFFFYLIRGLDLELYFSNSGLLPASLLMELTPVRFGVSIFNGASGMVWIWIAHVGFLLSLLGLIFGIWGRWPAIVAFVLHVSFVQRNMAAVFGIDLISTFFLFYLCMADQTGKGAPDSLRRSMDSMAFRLCQVQVCIIYAYSGMEKLQGSHWWKGEALWDVLANAQLARWDFSWLASFPLLIVIGTYLTLLWEVYFPILIWVRPLRYPMIIIGVFMHLGIAIAVSIPCFGLLMIVAYSLFIEETLAVRILGLFESSFPFFTSEATQN